MAEKAYYIIDFDSTFTQVEALDELVGISLEGRPEKEEIAKEIRELTDAAMSGRLSFKESLEKRVKLLHAKETHLSKLIRVLKKKVSPSFSRNRNFLRTHRESVYIVSGGFKEFIIPVVKEYGIKAENVFANTFTYDEQGNINGFDANNPLSEEGGKVKLLSQMKLKGILYGIGDGHSDYQLKESGLIRKFFAFTENISREKVIQNADHVTPSFDEFLFINQLPRAISYPKNRILCLLVGAISSETLAIFKNDGLSIRQKTSLEEKYRKDVGMLLLTEDAVLSDKELQACEKLKVIGVLGDSSRCFSLKIAAEKGIVLFDDKRHQSDNVYFIPKRMIDFINKGSTFQSRNFPNLHLRKDKSTHRFIHIHKNMPGVIAYINQVLASHHMNIEAQYLKTNAELGYVITDVNVRYDPLVISDLKKIPYTIKFRILY